MANPAYSQNPYFSGKGASAQSTISAEQLQAMYNQPSYYPPPVAAGPARMTVDDAVMKSLFCFGTLLVGGVIGWVTIDSAPWLWIVAGIVGFVLAMVNIFKREPSPALILGYSAAQGLFLGGISAYFEATYPGIVAQAVLATLAVVAVTLVLFATGKVRATRRATKVWLIAMLGYLLFSVINLFIMWFGGADGNPWGLRGSVEIFGMPLGFFLGIFAVIMGAYSLVMDFDFIQRGVQAGAPAKYSWTGAFGIMVTLIWLYTEILRLLAISRN
jgi:uncharacterized YccA/Bax inhibitor family protein